MNLPVFFCLVILSWCFCEAYRRFALSRQVMDIPNARSSHSTPTPRGGGVAFVPLGLLASVLAIVWFSPPLQWIYWAALSGAVILWLVGWVDDLYNLSAKLRLMSQATAMLCILLACIIWHPSLSEQTWGVRATFVLIGTLIGIWGINLFNFMDGTDGLAASQALVLLLMVAFVAHDSEFKVLIMLCTSFGAILLGFLFLNFPKASLFMGDSGSTTLGYLMVILIGVGVLSEPNLAVAALLGSVHFLVDASCTLVRRWWARENIVIPHREHLYQRLSRKFNSHLRLLLVWHVWSLLVPVPLLIMTIKYQFPAYAAVAIGYGLTMAVWAFLNHRLEYSIKHL